MKPFDRIYQVVAKIPQGKVMTYGQVAKLAGINNPRIVGFAMRTNKDTKKVPCHRVISSDGTLKGYTYGGIEKKKELLEKEGISFVNEQTVNLHKNLLDIN